MTMIETSQKRHQNFDVFLANQARQLASGFEQARSMVDEGIDDAEAHAHRALTVAAKEATDGRPTLATIRRGRSYPAALKKIDRVWANLVRLCEQHRISSYESAYIYFQSERFHHSQSIELETPSYPQSGLEAARKLVLHGRTLADELWTPTASVRDNLLAVLTLALRQTGTARQAVQLLDGWSVNSRGSLLRAVKAVLNDGQTAAESLAAGWVYGKD